MFTGLIQDIGIISSITQIGQSVCVKIKSDSVYKHLSPGDSLSVDGICLTVEEIRRSIIQITAVQATLKKTRLKSLKCGELVNLEPALKVADRLGGHLVQGHIDCVGQVHSIMKKGKSRLITVSVSTEYTKYLVKQGSIAVNGISLTLSDIIGTRFIVSVIPHTWENTNLKTLRAGSMVNIEFDYIGKWIENFILNDNKQSCIHIDRLKSLGF